MTTLPALRRALTRAEAASALAAEARASLPAGTSRVRVTSAMPWSLSHRADDASRQIADRHYNRQKPGTPQFVPPGRCLVLAAPHALWVTSWPFAEYVRHAWPGAWINSAFRREPGCEYLASDMIRAAVAATRARWPAVPDRGMVTFVDASKVRRKRDPGRCYLRAGFRRVGETKGGLLAFQMLPADMPAPLAAIGTQASLPIEAAEHRERVRAMVEEAEAMERKQPGPIGTWRRA